MNPYDAAAPLPFPPLTVTVSARALFDTSVSHEIFLKQGIKAFEDHERRHEQAPYMAGTAMPLVRRLLALPRGAVRLCLVTRNGACTANRIAITLEHHGLDRDIETALFTAGAPTAPYVKALGTGLFLSSNEEQVRRSLQEGIPAATIYGGPARDTDDRTLRVAFDGDAVLLSDEAERITHGQGLEAFHRHEHEHASVAMKPGPFMPLLRFLNKIQALSDNPDAAPIRIALVTARGMLAHQRVLWTFAEEGVRVDEAHFLAGREKTAFLRAFGAHIFFDDSRAHVDRANEAGIAAGHVITGIRNECASEEGFTGTPAPDTAAPPAANGGVVVAIDRETARRMRSGRPGRPAQVPLAPDAVRPRSAPRR